MTDQSDTDAAQAPPPRGPHTHAELNDARYAELAKSDDFAELRRRYRAFVFPWTVAFLVWYLLFVALSNWAPDFMGTTVVGNINVGLVRPAPVRHHVRHRLPLLQARRPPLPPAATRSTRSTPGGERR